MDGARIYKVLRDDQVGTLDPPITANQAVQHAHTYTLHISLSTYTCTAYLFLQYILDMLGYVRQFYLTYVKGSGDKTSRSSSGSNKLKPPPSNFVQPRGAYLLFLQRSKQLAQQAELLADLAAESIQRGDAHASFFKDD
ncbi:hypothetical protein EON63_21290 [archaeon]|nr:MAG: hypothetical protein EON63_21290 [archaeon]